MKKSFITKKLMAFLLAFAMIFSSMPLNAFADVDGGEGGSTAKTAEITLSYQAENVFVQTPQEVTVSSDLAEGYGYTDTVTDEVSALDVLVKLHEMTFGTESLTDVTDNLAVSSSGWVTKVMGEETSAFSFAIDGDYPCDRSGEYGQYGYTGYTIDQAPVENNGEVEFFLYQDSSCSDYYSYFKQDDARVKEITAVAGSEINLKLEGYMYAWGGSLNDEDRVTKGGLGAIADSQLVTVNAATGAMTEISGAVTDEDGNAVISFADAGTYYVSALSTDDKDIICPWLTVKVEEDASTGKVVLSGLHDAQVKSLKLYDYTDGTKGETDLLANVEAANSQYTKRLPAGDYWLEGYDENEDLNGGLKITVAAGKTNEFKIQRVYEISTNSGWVKDEDYTLDVKLTDANGNDRPMTLGTYVSGKGQSWEKTCISCIYVVGDTINATVTPDAEKHPTYNTASASKQLTANTNLSLSCAEFAAVTFTAPAGSVISAGTLTKYYVYSFMEPYSQSVAADGTVSVTYRFNKNTDYFYRVQNPNGVTYWNYKRWSAGETIDISEADLYIGDDSFNKNTVIDDFSKNVYDRADIYLNINAAGYKNMAVGDTFELNSFRNWFAIESYMNAKVALPDMHYEVINADGSPSDVVTITPDEKNSNVAVMEAKKPGTAIVLVTYDAMTHMAGMSSTSSKQFSAIWPECTGVFVVTVGADGTGIQTNMQMDRMDATISDDEQKTIDAEHDILFYLDDAGADYSFKPEAGCTVTVARSTVGNKMTFNGFTAEGVSVADDGTVTVSGLTTGRHIIKVEKNGVANYQVITARQVSYKLVDDDGNELTAEAANNIKAGDTVNIQFSGLLNPKEKLPGAYNFNFRLHYQGEDDTYFDSNAGGSFGVYDFSGNPARQKISITIPKYWTGDTYTLVAGALKQGGFAGVPTHRGITYASGTNPGFDAPSVSGILSSLPAITINLAETDFLTGQLSFRDETGKTIDRKDLTIVLKDSDGNEINVADDGSFKALAETYNYAIYADGYTYTTGSIDMTKGFGFYITLQSAPEGTWDGMSYDEPEKDGDVYVIKTGNELAWLSKQVADKKFTNFSARLANDINLGNYPWTAVNAIGYTYVYLLDGAGYEISGLNATKGLFGTIGGTSEIKDLTVSGAINNTEGSAGAIAGYLQGGTIQNCVSNVNITASGSGKTSFGGIAGYMSAAKIINCVNNGDINVEGKEAGGIVGSTVNDNAEIKGCYNTGAVSGNDEIGGILGGISYKSAVSDCYNTGEITGSGSYVGGVIGKTAGNVTSCYNVGTVNGGNGFAGLVTGKVDKCYALTDDNYAQKLSENQMKTAELGDGFKLICNGYPALSWQTGVQEHNPAENPVVTAPTCTERGYTTYTCTNCHETYVKDYVDATGHTEGADLTVYPAYKTYTCPTCNVLITVWNDARLADMTLPEANASDITMSDEGNYPWIWNSSENRLQSNNVGINNSTSQSAITFTLTYGGTLKFNYNVSSEAKYDKFTITLGSEKIADAISGTENGSVNTSLPAGTYTLTMAFTKDSSSADGSDMAWISDLELTAMSREEAEDAANIEAAAPVIEAIDAIGDVTLEKEQAIKDARAAYNALTETQKALVTNESILTAAETELANLKDEAAAKAVTEAIDAIGDVTLEKEQAIKDARAAYDALTDAQKALVENERVLTAAEAKLANLKNPSKPSNPSDDDITVTFRLIGSTLATSEVQLSKGEAGYNGAEYVTWVKTTTYTLDKDSTVGDLFEKAMADADLSYEGLESNYISTITAPKACGGYDLSEMTNGPNSGWMYTVNGSHPDRGLNDWTLFDGDKVVWHYVNDYAYEVSDWEEGTLGDGSLHDKWLDAADVKPTSASSGGGSAVDGNQTAADNVINLIDKIGTVTKDSGNAIKAARTAYDSLTDAQKKLVTNYSTLTKAEADFAALNESTGGFTDVKDDHWAKSAIDFVVKNNLFQGTSATTFEPETAMNRGMLVTVLWRLEGKPAPADTAKFDDVKAGAYYAEAVAWASENGIVKGVDTAKFAPEDKVSREQMAAIFARYAEYKGYDVTPSADLGKYTDSGKISAYALDNIKWANAVGLITGRTADTLAPQGDSTRAEVATMIQRFVENIMK